MSASKLLINLYEYKKWSESSIFDYLLAPDQDKFPEAFTKALYYLSHINIVDKIFIARLKGEPPVQTSVVTNETQNIVMLEKDFTATNEWLLTYVKNLPEVEFQDEISFQFFDGDKGRMTKEQILTHLITHGLLHKGDIGSILPREIMLGWKSNYTSFLHR
ncbi:DinB family protein [compost metagenome]